MLSFKANSSSRWRQQLTGDDVTDRQVRCPASSVDRNTEY